MSTNGNAPATLEREIDNAETAVEAIRAALGEACRSVMLVAGVVDGEVSGVVIGETDDDDYISAQELAAGGVYLVIGLGKLPTEQPAGVTVLT